ncbi:putative endonuclease [Sphingomonas guangdongensis]|uniref:Putative endonuclease n=1 Tax=Sphingomonas guangdongensis TaxID=1141890 RepID=A0A285QGG3_9SPHN|nr:GIY-YIG nuclease family protein [Sphingomonas guangdongensis]SOB79217.1 putative endonuclease [Sphingomonas guangdongensis]
MEKRGYVYMMASGRNGTLYIGVTSDLLKRTWEHREGIADGFTKRYGCRTLVWFEAHDRIDDAIRREKQMKEWRRAWKLRQIEASNPDWQDLYPTLM